MGRVYLAEQINLNKQVALKVLRAPMAEDPTFARRFQREATSASMLSHPNVLQMIDFGDDDGLLFIAMELLIGRDLSRVIVEDWPLPVARIGHIGAQILSALDEAHAKGVVHRDLKPDNVMLLDVRGECDFVKVCDFGLAKVADGHEGERSAVTLAGSICGTPEYMSPEQARGEPLDGRSDLYSAAIILYEMVVGDVPFRASSSLGVLTRHLQDPPEPPSKRVQHGVPAAFEAVIMKGLAKARADRFATAAEMKQALLLSLDAPVSRDPSGRTGPRAQASEISLSPSMAEPTAISLPWHVSRWLKWPAAVAAIAIVALAVGVGVRSRQRANHGERTASALVRRSVAVLGFQNLSGQRETAWLSTALADMLGTELSQGGRLRTLGGEEVARMKTELRLGDANSLGHDSLARIRRNLDADLVLLGSYTALDGEVGQLRVDLRVQDTALGETVASAAEVGARADLFALVGRLGLRLRLQLGVATVSNVDERAARATLPDNLDAARDYAEGIVRLRVSDALGARDLLERALAIDPSHAPSHAALAQALAQLGYDSRAENESSRALELAGPLPREQRLAIEALHDMLTNDFKKAVKVYRTLVDFFPDNLDYGLRLARAQRETPDYKAALATLDRLSNMPGAQRDDPRIDLERAATLFLVGENRAALAAAERARNLAQARGADQLVARSLGLTAFAYQRLGEYDRAIARAEESKAIFRRLGDRRDMGQPINVIAICFAERSDHLRALRAFEEGLALSQDLGNRSSIAVALANSGQELDYLGRRAEAIERFSRSLAVNTEINDAASATADRASLAQLRLELGKLQAAQRSCDEVIGAARRVDDRTMIGDGLVMQSEVSEALGELARARAQVSEGRAFLEATGSQRSVAHARYRESSLFRSADRLGDAVRSLDEASGLLRKIGDLPSADATELDRAILHLEQGDAASAAQLVTQVISALTARPSDADVISFAHDVLARALLAQGQVAAARAEVVLALKQLPSEPRLDRRLALQLTLARLESSEGLKARARRRVTQVLASARRAHHVALELESRLVGLELGDPSAHAARALRDEAVRHGFLLIGRKAAVFAG